MACMGHTDTVHPRLLKIQQPSPLAEAALNGDGASPNDVGDGPDASEHQSAWLPGRGNGLELNLIPSLVDCIRMHNRRTLGLTLTPNPA